MAKIPLKLWIEDANEERQKWQGFLRCARRSFCFGLDSLFEVYGSVNNEPLQPQYILSEKLENISDT